MRKINIIITANCGLSLKDELAAREDEERERE
jgi:hypothetical protein